MHDTALAGILGWDLALPNPPSPEQIYDNNNNYMFPVEGLGVSLDLPRVIGLSLVPLWPTLHSNCQISAPESHADCVQHSWRCWRVENPHSRPTASKTQSRRIGKGIICFLFCHRSIFRLQHCQMDRTGKLVLALAKHTTTHWCQMASAHRVLGLDRGNHLFL
jgi:hypothetical protein